jgi:hypothetical protein
LVCGGWNQLNLIDDYNNNMNNVDLADQLRNCYRFNHWLRNRKWWWAIYLWALGVAATNAYVMYEKMYEQEKTGHREMPKKWTHQEFLVQLIYDFMGMTEMPAAEVDDESTQVTTRSMAAAVQSDMSSASGKYNLGTDKGRLAYCQEVRAYNVTVNRMEDNWFKDRTNGRYHPSIENAFEGGLLPILPLQMAAPIYQ